MAIDPTTGIIETNIHHPERSVSCNRLMVTANDGKKINNIYKGLRKSVPSRASIILNNRAIMALNKAKNQYSLRLARPVKVAYCFNAA